MGLSWKQLLDPECFEVARQLGERAKRERAEGLHIYPPQKDIFRAFALTQPEDVKVIIVGQDPYHTPGTANGLAFSVSPQEQIPPSLRNVFTELVRDVECGQPPNGDLTKWGQNGVLLMNTILTVYEHEPLSHAGWGWQDFTKEVLRKATTLPQPIVFMLWGAHAQDFKKYITQSLCTYEPGGVIRQNIIKKGIIMSSHPSPFSVNKTCRDTPAFYGSRPFSKANEMLIGWGGTPVDWQL